MPILFAIMSGVLFAVWHSFSDALAWRICTAWYSPRRKEVKDKLKFVFGASSRCEFCEVKVPWYGLIPIAGFFILRRRCAHCSRLLSWRFPLLEACALVYGVAFAQHEPSPLYFTLTLLTYTALWVVIAIDYRMLLIPTEAIFALLVLGLFALLCIRHPHWYRFDNFDFGLDLSVAFLWYFLFHLLRIASGYKMGLADVRLVLALGFLLGHPLTIFLPGVAAAFAIIFYLLRRRSLLIYAPSETEIPFGVFLGAAFLLLNLSR